VAILLVEKHSLIDVKDRVRIAYQRPSLLLSSQPLLRSCSSTGIRLSCNHSATLTLLTYFSSSSLFFSLPIFPHLFSQDGLSLPFLAIANSDTVLFKILLKAGVDLDSKVRVSTPVISDLILRIFRDRMYCIARLQLRGLRLERVLVFFN
jgi:hypothetical protein